MSSIGKRKLSLSSIVLPLLFAIWPAALRSQSCCPDFRLELLEAQQTGIEFRQRLLESRAWRDRERRNVPTYNARLNGAVLAFTNTSSRMVTTSSRIVPCAENIESNQILFEETRPGDEVNRLLEL